MKETKVYVDELPAQCLDCRFAYDGRCQAKGNGESYCIENCRRSDCPLIDIKTHDRELVKEVCEKIKELWKEQGIYYYICDSGEKLENKTYKCTIFGMNETLFDNMINQIKKEYEK